MMYDAELKTLTLESVEMPPPDSVEFKDFRQMMQESNDDWMSIKGLVEDAADVQSLSINKLEEKDLWEQSASIITGI